MSASDSSRASAASAKRSRAVLAPEEAERRVERRRAAIFGDGAASPAAAPKMAARCRSTSSRASTRGTSSRSASSSAQTIVAATGSRRATFAWKFAGSRKLTRASRTRASGHTPPKSAASASSRTSHAGSTSAPSSNASTEDSGPPPGASSSASSASCSARLSRIQPATIRSPGRARHVRPRERVLERRTSQRRGRGGGGGGVGRRRRGLLRLHAQLDIVRAIARIAHGATIEYNRWDKAAKERRDIELAALVAHRAKLDVAATLVAHRARRFYQIACIIPSRSTSGSGTLPNPG